MTQRRASFTTPDAKAAQTQKPSAAVAGQHGRPLRQVAAELPVSPTEIGADVATQTAVAALLHALGSALGVAPTVPSDFCGDSGAFRGAPGAADRRSSEPHFEGSADSAVSAAHDEAPDPALDPTLALLTVEEAARRLRVGRTTAYSLIASGELESVTVGRLRRVPAEAIPEYVARLRQTTRSCNAA